MSESVIHPSDEIRSKLVERFNNFKPALEQYYAYASEAAALAQEYHNARFAELYPAVKVEELTLLCSLDSRESPASLDKKISEIGATPVKKIVFDRAQHTYHLFI